MTHLLPSAIDVVDDLDPDALHDGVPKDCGLTTYHELPAIVRRYEHLVATLKRCGEDIANAEHELNSAFACEDPGDRSYVHVQVTRHSTHFDVENACKVLRGATWRRIIDKLEVKRFASVKGWDEIQRCIERDEMPEVSMDSVRQVYEQSWTKRGDMLTEAVQEAFDFLRPRRSDCKRNSQEEVPRRVIVHWAVESWMGGKLHVRYSRQVELMALERVLSMLSGRGEISKGHRSEIETAVLEASVGRTAFFAYRACKNGNLHLDWLDDDLRRKFNAIAGGKRLRPSKNTGASRGTEMEVA